MPDAWGNKLPAEMAVDAETLAGAQGSEPYAENTYDIAIWATNPDSAKSFDEISKDVSLSNLDAKEVELVRECGDLANEFRIIGFPKDAEFFRFKVMNTCVTSLGKGGFAQRQLGTTRKELEFRGYPAGATAGQQKGGPSIFKPWTWFGGSH